MGHRLGGGAGTTHMLTYINTYRAGLAHSQTGNEVVKFSSLLPTAGTFRANGSRHKGAPGYRAETRRNKR